VPGDEQRQSRNDGRDNYRIEESIDDNVQDQIDNRAKDQRTSSGYQDNYQDFRKDSFRQESFRQDSFRQVPSYGGGEIPVSSDSSEKDFEVAEEVDGLEDRRMGIMDNLGELGALKIIPVFIFVVLVLVLALTFITETLPEFPGALTSSILIVTLIIYGAATLLKA
jgi:hypothetical protein